MYLLPLGFWRGLVAEETNDEGDGVPLPLQGPVSNDLRLPAMPQLLNHPPSPNRASGGLIDL